MLQIYRIVIAITSIHFEYWTLFRKYAKKMYLDKYWLFIRIYIVL